jgi:hypothetical protein
MISAFEKSWLIDGLFDHQIPTEETMIRWLQEHNSFLSAAIFTEGKAVVHVKLKGVPMSIRDVSMLEALYSAVYMIAEFTSKQEEKKIEEPVKEEIVEEKLATIIQFPLGGRQVS